MAAGQQIRGVGDEENVNLLYVAITRTKRFLVLNDGLFRQLSSQHMRDSLFVAELDSDAALGLPVRCCNCETIVQADAENVTGGPVGAPPRRLVYAGSMSKKIVCQTCVEGDGRERGRVSFFPYAAELLRRGI
ncbi:unnamed protein product [Laminaria digitata]